jgi:hypothetical protein
MLKQKKEVRPPPCEIRFAPAEEGLPCLMCGCAARTVATRLSGSPKMTVGICESCSVHVYWTWKQLYQDADPGEPDESGALASVRVVLARRARLPSGELAAPGAPESYEVAMVRRSAEDKSDKADGGVDLPSANVRKGEPLYDAVKEALGKHGVVTWAPCVEPLYAALSPRGRLVRVVLVTAYTTWKRESEGARLADAPAGKLDDWRPWPPWEQAPDLAALYIGLRDVWPLRIWKHELREGSREGRAEEISTCLRRAAAEYIYLQQDLRTKKPGVDASAAEILRRGMSNDEKLVEKMLAEDERRLAERLEQEAAEKRAGTLPLVLGSGAVTHDGATALPAGPPPDAPAAEGGEGDLPGDEGSIDDQFEEEPSRE